VGGTQRRHVDGQLFAVDAARRRMHMTLDRETAGLCGREKFCARLGVGLGERGDDVGLRHVRDYSGSGIERSASDARKPAPSGITASLKSYVLLCRKQPPSAPP